MANWLEEPVTDVQPSFGAPTSSEDASPHAAEPSFRVITPRRTINATKLIITTGGKSYPGCGTSGDGYQWLERLGHSIVPLRPALTPITSNAEWIRELKGITIPDVHLRVWQPEQIEASDAPTDRSRGRRKSSWLAERRGSLLFTHFGLSGPVVLDVSRVVSGHSRPQSLVLHVDFLPGRSADHLDRTLRDQAQRDGRRLIISVLTEIVPRRLAEMLLKQMGLPPEWRMAELSNAMRTGIVSHLKETKIPASGTMGFRKAEVTAGGVSLREVDSRTMESRIVPGLYLAGEILDLDGPIGGFNFQAAFSTGMLAGNSV